MLAENFEQISNGIESIATVLALGIGGYWTYINFIRTRSGKQRAKTKHLAEHWEIEDKYVLRIALHIENLSRVLIPIEEGYVEIMQIFPVSEQLSRQFAAGEDLKPVENLGTYQWNKPSIKKIAFEPQAYEIEPGESDTFHFEFIVEKKCQVIQIKSHIQDMIDKRNIGWNHLSTYRFGIAEV